MFFSVIAKNIQDFRRKYKNLRRIPLAICVETNSRFDGDAVRKLLTFQNLFGQNAEARIGNFSFEVDNSIERTGVIKTYERTKSYLLYFDHILTEKKLRIHEHAQTANTDQPVERFLREAKEELGRFMWPDVDHDNPRLKKTKIGGKTSCGKNDDVAIVTLMLVYYAKVRRRRNEMVAEYHASRNRDPNNVGYIGM